MSATVQVCGVFEEDGECVPFVPDNVADFYGVYIGLQLFDWVADFQTKEDALAYAMELCRQHDYKLDDRTFATR